MSKRKPLPDLETSDHRGKNKSKLDEKPVDIDEHKKIIRKFMRLHKKMQHTREQRSVEYV